MTNTHKEGDTPNNKSWADELKQLRVEGYSWKEDDDIDSFRKGELEQFISSLLQSERQKGRNERYCFREQRDKCSCRNEDSWETSWKDICTNEDGSINLEQIKKELSDFSHILEQIPTLYSELTGGTLSKPGYWAQQIREVNSEVIERAVEEAEKEEREKTLEEVIEMVENPNESRRSVLKELRNMIE